MTIIAIDPGASGGIAVQDRLGVSAWKMPSTERETVQFLKDLTIFSRVNGPKKIAYVEQLVKHMGPGQPASRMAVYASNWGVVVGALLMAGWQLVIVRAQDWQEGLGLGISGKKKCSKKFTKKQNEQIKLENSRIKRDWKNKLKSEAVKSFPRLAATLKTADALLILKYATKKERYE